MNLTVAKCEIGTNKIKMKASGLHCLLLGLVFAALSCKSEKITPPTSTCDIGMAYDAESTTLILPANPADVSLLSTLDRALMLPQRERRMESVCVMQDGTYTIETELMEPSDPIEYPERTVGLWPKPAYKKMVNANGIITYYNGENEQINNEVTYDRSSDALAVVLMFQEMKNNPIQSDQKFTNYIDALSANGLPHTAQSSNIYTTQVNNPDGTSSVMVVDKNARMKVGQIDFDTNGHPCTMYMLKVEGQAPNVEFKQMTQIIYFNAVDSIRPLSLRAGTSDVLTIYGANFGNTQGSSYVEFTDASEGITNGVNWIQPLTKDYVSWGENQIKVVVPSVCIDNNTTTTDVYAGTGKIRVRVSGSTVQSDEKLTLRFAAYNTFYPDSGGVDKRKMVRLADWNENGGYNLYYTNELKNLTGGVAAFERALNTWRCTTNINFVVIDTTPPSYLLPFRCRIHYGALPAGVPTSTKATTTPTFDACANGPNAVFLGYMKNFDMIFKSSGINWHTGTLMPTLNWNTELDFESFALHELGHAGLLRHTNNGDDLMYYRIEEYKRELEANDLEGGIYEKDLGISNDPNNCTTPMSPYLCTNSIDEGEQVRKFIKVVPNPISEQFYIEYECDSNRDFQITILAIDGQIVLQNRIISCRDVIDIKNLKSGVYIIKLLTNTGIIHYGKIIKG